MRRTAKALVLLSLVGCSGTEDASPATLGPVASAAQRIAAVETATTAPVAAVDTTVVVTTTTVAPTTTTVPITAPPPPVDPVFTPLPANGSLITSASNNWLGVEPHYLDAVGPVSDCNTFFSVISPDPYIVAQCGAWVSGPLTFAYTVTQNTLADGIHALLWRETAPQTWEPVLKQVSEPGVLTSVSVALAQLTDSVDQELVVSFFYAGTQELVDVDVIDLSTGFIQVVAHVPGLALGQVVTGPTSLELWVASSNPGDGTCCVFPFQQAFLMPGLTLTYGALGEAPQE